MPRRARLAMAGIAWHVIQRGNNRSACFYAEEDCRFYLNTLKERAEKHGCAIHAYVLMTNHVHLLLTPSRVESVALMMKHLGQRYVQYINRIESPGLDGDGRASDEDECLKTWSVPFLLRSIVKKKTLVMALFLVAYSGVAFSASSGRVFLERIGTADYGVSILWAKGGWGSVANNDCSTGPGVLAFDSTTSAGQAMLSVALAAYIAGKPLQAFTSDTGCLSVGGMAPKVIRIDLIP